MTTLEIGRIAEEIAMEEERLSIPPELRAMIRSVSENTLLGYDIESISIFENKVKFKAIEVKAWNREGFFQVSANEVAVLRALREAGWIYLVDISKKRIIKKINDPFNGSALSLQPTNFKAFF